MLKRMQDGAGTLAAWSVVLLGASIPLSVAVDNILAVLILLAWLASGGVAASARLLRDNPIAVLALALWCALAAGLLWGQRDPGDGALYLGKYGDLLLVPLFATLFMQARRRRHALLAYVSAIVVTLLLSLLLAAGLIPAGVFKGDSLQPMVFKLWLTQNILMAIGAYLCVLFAREATTQRAAWTWLALAAVAALDVIVLVQGRTGMAILALLVLYGAYVWRGWPALGGAMAAGVCFVAVGAALMPTTAARFAEVVSEARAWRPDEPTLTSTGLRLGFYRSGVALLAAHPFIGSGTGSYPRVSREQVAGTAVAPTTNPHNEYLLLGVQLGLGGPLLLIALFVVLWRSAARMPPLERDVTRGTVIAFAAGCLLNSMLLDHTEGLLFAWLAGLAAGTCATGTQMSRRA